MATAARTTGEKPDRQPGHPNLKRNHKGQAPPTAGTKGGNGAWSKKSRAVAAKRAMLERAVAAQTHEVAEKGDTGVASPFEQLRLLDLTPQGRLDRQQKFLQSYLEFGTVTAGCRGAGVSRRQYYHWLEKYPDFKEAVDVALEGHVDDLEEAARTRAKEKSDLLMIFLLKRHRPEFRDSHQVPGGSGAEGSKPQEQEEAEAAAAETVKSRLNSLRARRIANSGVKVQKKLPKSTSEDEFEDEEE